MVKPVIKNLKENKFTFLLFLILSLHLFFLIFTRFTAWPEMSLWPYLVSKGWLLYKDIGMVHTPILILVLSIFNSLAGFGITQLKIFTWALILLSDLLLYFSVKKLWDKKTALISVLVFIPLNLLYEGNGLWFDLALIPVFVPIFYFLKQKKFTLAGILWIVSFFIKQTSFWILIPIAYSLFKNHYFSFKKSVHDLEYFVIGILISLFTILVTFVIFGIMPDFIFWSVRFGIFHLPKAQGQVFFPSIKTILFNLIPFSVIFLSFILNRKNFNKDLFLWSIFPAFGILPRWELFHFQPALPFLAIFFAVFINSKALKNKFLIPIKFVLILVLFAQFTFAVLKVWKKEVRFFDDDVKKVVSSIDNLNFDERSIYIVNYWDNIYAFTDTLPSTKHYIPYLAWYINYGNIKNHLISEIKLNLPEAIVRQKYSDSGLASFKIDELEEIIERYYFLGSSVLGNVDIYLKNK